jgi:hypothetical protein
MERRMSRKERGERREERGERRKEKGERRRRKERGEGERREEKGERREEKGERREGDTQRQRRRRVHFVIGIRTTYLLHFITCILRLFQLEIHMFTNMPNGYDCVQNSPHGIVSK